MKGANVYYSRVMLNETNLQLDESVVDLLENFACHDDTHRHGQGDIRITGVTAKTLTFQY